MSRYARVRPFTQQIASSSCWTQAFGLVCNRWRPRKIRYFGAPRAAYRWGRQGSHLDSYSSTTLPARLHRCLSRGVIARLLRLRTATAPLTSTALEQATQVALNGAVDFPIRSHQVTLVRMCCCVALAPRLVPWRTRNNRHLAQSLLCTRPALQTIKRLPSAGQQKTTLH